MKTSEDRPSTVEPAAARAGWGRGVVLAVLAAVVLVAALLVVVTADDDGTPQSATPTTVPTTAPTTTAPFGTVDRSAVVWPFAGSSVRYDDPVDAARAFATTYLRFEAPVVGAFHQGDSRSGEVEVRPAATGPVTTIMVRQLGGQNDDAWSVLGAGTANIDVTSPHAGDEIASPVRVTGRALAFEGTVKVEVRQDGALGPLGAGFVTGGGDELRPFDGEVPFETAGSPHGALVLFTESADNGQVWEAAALPVRLRRIDIDAAACGTYRAPRPQPGAGEMEVTAYFTCDARGGGASVVPVYRLVPRSSAVLRASLDALVAGPSATERAAGLSSWFSADTDGMVRSVTLRDRHAVVDLDDLPSVIPNASTSAGSALLLSQLDTTVFQFRSVESVEYRLAGGCGAFSEWLQYGGCEPRTRAEVSAD